MTSLDVMSGLVKNLRTCVQVTSSYHKVEAKNHTETTVSYYQTVRHPTPQYSRRRENLRYHVITSNAQWLICVAIIPKFAEFLLYPIT
jgi:hypothetical protein